MAALVDPQAVDPGALLRAAENSDLRVAESDAAFPLLLFVWPVQTLQFPRRTRVHSRDELGSQQQHLGPKYAALGPQCACAESQSQWYRFIHKMLSG